LRTITADHLKLDGSLVRDIGQHGGDDPVVRSIILLAHSLHMAVVSEWVTTEDQVQRLRLLGCDYMQGHRIGVPTDIATFESSLRSRAFDRRQA
jgi:EAL domain-containing protein (putative c-di-GMP-specific phosphodiesterase class I)